MLPIKIDKQIFMNFSHSLVGGSLGGLWVVAYSNLPLNSLGNVILGVSFFVLCFIVGIFIMGYINYKWITTKSKRKKHGSRRGGRT